MDASLGEMIAHVRPLSVYISRVLPNNLFTADWVACHPANPELFSTHDAFALTSSMSNCFATSRERGDDAFCGIESNVNMWLGGGKGDVGDSKSRILSVDGPS